jgi:hypothetical protein
MSSKIKLSKETIPNSILEMLNEFRVEFMLFDSYQDRHWIRSFKKSAEWEIDSVDRDTVLFVRSE